MKPKVFKYTLIEFYDISELERFKDHRRLQTFYYKGCKCVSCSRVGTKLALGKSKHGSFHVDLYTDDLTPMTVDHIIPKSKGGQNKLSNYQPMCVYCNTDKGNDDKLPKTNKNKYIKTNKLKIGLEVYKLRGRKKYKYVGVISKFVINPHIEEKAFMVQGNNISMYSVKNTYLIQK